MYFSALLRLDGAAITTKALRKWLRAREIVSEIYYIRQSKVHGAVGSATLFPLIVQASGCSSFLAARRDATAQLRVEQTKLAATAADVEVLKEALTRAEREHQLVLRRTEARASLHRVEGLVAEVSHCATAANLAAASGEEAELVKAVGESRGGLAECSAAAVTLQTQIAEEAPRLEEALGEEDGLKELTDKLLPTIENEEARLEESAIEAAAARARLASIRRAAQSAAASDSGLETLTALGEERAQLEAVGRELLAVWSSIDARLAQAIDPEEVARELGGEGRRLGALRAELLAARGTLDTDAHAAHGAAERARNALASVREDLASLEARRAELSGGAAAVRMDERTLRELASAESRQGWCRAQIGRLRAELGELDASVTEAIRPRGRPAHGAATLGALLAVERECAHWAGALDSLLAPNLHVLVVETTAEARRLLERGGAAGGGGGPLRVWPLDRIERTDIAALARAQAEVIRKSGVADGAVVGPLILLGCAAAAGGEERSRQQAVALAVGTRLLTRDGVTAQRVLDAASGALAWCVTECVSADGARHRRGSVRGGYDDHCGSQLVNKLSERARVASELRELEAEAASLERVSQQLRQGEERERAKRELEERVDAARACLDACARAAGVREDSSLLARRAARSCGCKLDIVKAASSVWPVAAVLAMHDGSHAQRARELVAAGRESLALHVRERAAAVDDQLALAEGVDLQAHGRAEAAAELCEQLDFRATASSARAADAVRRLAELDAELARLCAQFERTAAGTAQLRERASAQQRQLTSVRARMHEAGTTLAAQEVRLREVRAELERLARETADAPQRSPLDAAAGRAELPPVQPELAALLARCRALHEDDGARPDAIDAWRTLLADSRAFQVRANRELRALDVESIDEARVLREAVSRAPQRAELAEFEAKRQMIVGVIAALVDGIVEADARSRQAIDDSLRAVTLRFGAMFAELVPSKEATIITVQGGSVSEAAEGLERKLCVAVRARSPDGNAPWSEDLRELSGGQRTLLSLALLVSCSLHKPSDLLVMDEVDAALDDKNVELVAQLLSRVSQNSQVIAISHRNEFQKFAAHRIPISAGSHVRASVPGPSGRR